MKNVADTLRTRTPRLPWIGGGVAAAALVVAGVLAGPSIAANLNPTVTPSPPATEYHETLTPGELDAVQQQADLQAASIADGQKAAAAKAAQEKAAALHAAHQQQAVDGPIKCDAGYTANAVDPNGNESNCQKDGPSGTQCVAYDDNNNCTQYYKP